MNNSGLYELFLMSVRRVLILLTSIPIIATLLGAELSEKLQSYESSLIIGSALCQVALWLWSAWTKMREKARLQKAAAASPTTVELIKERVADQPIKETIRQGLR